MEMMIILLLLGVMMFLAVPAFQNLLQGRVQQETNRLAGIIRLLRNEAVLGRATFRLMVDFKERRYSVEQLASNGEFIQRTDPAQLRPHAFPGAFQLKALIMYGEDVSRERKEPIPIVIDPSGFIDPFLLQFTENDAPYTFRITGFTGRVELVKGLVEK
jgi:competence protein ComGC